MNCQLKHLFRMLVTGVIFLLLTLLFSKNGGIASITHALPDVQSGNTSFLIDFSLGVFDTELQNAVHEFLTTNIDQIPTQERNYTVTVQYEDQMEVMHIRLFPTAVYESGWTIPFGESDVISLSIKKMSTEVWNVAFEDQPANTSNLIQQATASYSFPWTNGQTWAKTQGFHYQNIGYSLDFAPRNGASNNVLAIEAGIFSPYCYISGDPYQAMVLITHTNGDKSGYLHLDKNSVPSNRFNQSITKGFTIGSLYTGSVIYNPAPACTDLANYRYATACGCGYATHLHFETSSLLTIQGYTLSSISSAANGTLYTSDNVGDSNCCGCTLANQNPGATAVFPSPFSALKPDNPFTALQPPAPQTEPAFISEIAPDNDAPEFAGIEAPELAAAEAAVPNNTPSTRTLQIDDRDVANPLNTVLNYQPPASSSYTLAATVIAAGGGRQSSSSYIGFNTIGQAHQTAVLRSGSYQVHSGFESFNIQDGVVTLTRYVYLPMITKP